VTETVEPPEVRRLPPGSHGIPAEVVARNQRERLIAAIAEVCAERGYAEASVTEVVSRAGVSSVTFYKQFADKRECLLAAHRELLDRLLETIDRAVEREGDLEGRRRAPIRAILSAFAVDPPSAQLLTVEILAAGSAGAKAHDAAVRALTTRLWAEGEPPDGRLALSHRRWAKIAGMMALMGQLIVAGEAERLPDLEDELFAYSA
jgi:AcrR family transcriptional regulator